MDASSPDIDDDAATPLMAQYLDIKREAGDALLFFRMGDFFELFFEDAVKAAAALDITLTKRGKHRGADIAMCGVPHHAHEAYLARLIRKGFKVAICEQVEDPAAARKRGSKSVVRRAIVRVVTPGTLTEDTLLEAGRNNFLGALTILRGGAEAAIAWSDVSTGELYVRATSAEAVRADAAALALAELVVPDEEERLSEAWREALADLAAGLTLTRQPSALFESRSAERRLKDIFSVAALDGFGDFDRAELSALGALTAYIELTQVGRMPALRPPRRALQSETMAIDPATRASLELFAAQGGGREGSLIAAIDRTRTGAGARLLAARLSAPLTDPQAINARLDAVAAFVDETRLRADVRAILARTPDIARALTRLSLGRGGPRDLLALRLGVEAAAAVAASLGAAQRLAPPPAELAAAVAALSAPAFAAFKTLLAEALAPEPPLLARDGGFIAKGYDPGLDAVRALRDESRRVIAGLEAEHRAATDIRALKVKHNNVLGYFIEVPPAQVDRLFAPPLAATFIHRQTLAGAVRFTTTALADLDARIARARDEAMAREMEIFADLSAAALEIAGPLAGAAEALAAIDVAAALGELAAEHNYVRPLIDRSLAFEVRGGRHPVVEQAAARDARGRFTPNDCVLSRDDRALLHLVTGPNMAGKSTFLRQNAIIAILAQAGAFVPARAAHLGVCDRVFSRVGAADDLARGRSTFMVEMVETAAILNQATERALVILDEIGRGTSTFDGLSIAWAAVEHLHERNGCRGLFATHYHELTALAARLPRLENVSMRVREWKGEVIFLHEVAAGPADRSYGVAVARLAGMPASVVRRAEGVLALLEAGRAGPGGIADLPLFAALGAAPDAASPQGPPSDPLREALGALNPDDLAPREALDALYRLKSLAGDV